MPDVICLLFHLLTTLASLIRAGGRRTVIAENLLLKQQLIVHSRAKEVIDDIVAMKRRNPRYGCTHTAQQINLAFGLELDTDVVRRILATHYRPEPGNSGPSWLKNYRSHKGQPVERRSISC